MQKHQLESEQPDSFINERRILYKHHHELLVARSDFSNLYRLLLARHETLFDQSLEAPELPESFAALFIKRYSRIRFLVVSWKGFSSNDH
uniref:DNA helicase n=1 Tax=Steinernema glaseri TaxID=37863 RepID=A0A1I7YAL4_9BILA